MYNNNGDLEFKINEGSGKGKEYNYLGKQIFEGVYNYGEREGFGKEFNNGIVIFEGKYKNGKKYGKGREYNKYGKLIFEGEFYEGEKKKGSLKEYFNDKFLFNASYLKYNNSWSYRISIYVNDYSLEKDFEA